MLVDCNPDREVAMKGVRVALGAATMAGLVVSSVALAAAGTPAGGKIKIFVASPEKLKSRVVVVGAIGDYGTAVSQDKNGKPDLDGVFEKFTLKHGGFTVDATVLNQALGTVKPKVNPATCSVEFAGQRVWHGDQRNWALHGYQRHAEDQLRRRLDHTS